MSLIFLDCLLVLVVLVALGYGLDRSRWYKWPQRPAGIASTRYSVQGWSPAKSVLAGGLNFAWHGEDEVQEIPGYKESSPEALETADDYHGAEMPVRFILGHVVATPGALETLQKVGLSPLALLSRHSRGDWGNMSKEDLQANEEAVVEGSRIFSAYQLPGGEKVWIITEGDRSSTCLLLPEEY